MANYFVYGDLNQPNPGSAASGNPAAPWSSTQAVPALGAVRVCSYGYSTVAARGFVYELTGGTTYICEATEPTWPLTVGDTVVDGTCIWTCRRPTSPSLPSYYRFYVRHYTVADGDRIFYNQLHNVTVPGAVPTNNTGSPSAFIEEICVGDWVASPTTVSSGATESTTGADFYGMRGFSYINGLTLTAGSGAGAANFVAAANANDPQYHVFENCTLGLSCTGAAARIVFGAGVNSLNDDSGVELINTKLLFNNTAQTVNMNTNVRWLRTPTALTGAAVPDKVFTPIAGSGADLELLNVDLSALITGKALVAMNAATPNRTHVENVKLGSGGSLTSGTSAGPGGCVLRAVNVDTGGTNYKYQITDYRGTVIQETTIVRTGGQTDGVTPASIKLVSSANTKRYLYLSTPVITRRFAAGVAKTITIYFVNDGLTLTDADVSFVVDFMASGTDTLLSSVAVQSASILATGTNHTASAVAWTTTGLTTPIKQQASVTFTPQQNCDARIRMRLHRPSTTMYVDGSPLVS